MLDGTTYMIATLYFIRISKDWFWFVMIGYLWNFLSVIGAWFLPESPRYLCEKNQIYELERSLKVIAKINGKPLDFKKELF